MGQTLVRVLEILAQVVNSKLVLRVPAWLRATLYYLSMAALIYFWHLGKLTGTEATGIAASLVLLLQVEVGKTVPGEGISASLLQAPMSSKPEPGTTTPFTQQVVMPIPLGEEFEKKK